MPAKGQCKYTPEELEKKVEEYFDYCKNTMVEAVVGKQVIQVSKPPHIIGLALYLGMHRDTIYRYLNGDYRGSEEAQNKVSDILSRARDRIVLDAYEGAALGRYNERITQLKLGRMGESVKQEIQANAELAVTWQGATAQEADEYSG